MIQIPEAPKPDATQAERQAFDDACRVADLQLRAEALAQEESKRIHRDRMALATEKNATALRAVADKTEGGPTLADQKRAAVIQLLSTQARGNRKPATFVADVREQVDAVFAVLSAAGV
jgi:hypothetical protein